MKKQNLLLIVLSSLLLSWSAYSQDGCGGLTLEGCSPTVHYDVDESGNLIIARADLDNGYLRTRIFSRIDGAELTLVKEFGSDSSLQEIKLADDNILYSGTTIRNSQPRVVVKMIKKGSSGGVIESEIFPELFFDYTNFFTYQYSNLAFLDGYAYAKRTKISWNMCFPTGCFSPNGNEVTYLKANLATGVIGEVGSIPGYSASESRYFLSGRGNDIYRVDTLNNYAATLWIQGYNEDGGETFGNSSVIGDLVYYTYTRLDGSTALVVANINDDVPQPVKILVTNLAGGWIYLVDYQSGESDDELYSLDLKLFNSTEEQVETNGVYQISPSRLACGIAVDSTEKRKFVLKCLKKDTTAPGGKILVNGCKVKVNLDAGNNDGGHDEQLHILKDDRWGKLDITTDLFITVPEAGLEFYYEAPEASVEAMISFEVKDPSGSILKLKPERTLQVKSEAVLLRLGIEGLRTDITSHPGNGDYVTESMHTKLAQAISEFRAEVATIYGISFVPELETEGASLVWGGLFDVHQNWTPPHCGHRNGNHIDLSMSVFNVYNPDMRLRLRTLLDERIRFTGLYYPVLSESPSGGNHWHVQD